MNFFKKLFSSGKENEPKEQEVNVNSIYSDTYFNERYTEQDLKNDPVLLDGCIKMIEGFFIANKVERKVENPVNHPVNLDQTIDEGFGFRMYCKAFQFGDAQTGMFLAYAFSGFLINNYGFKLYKDNKPEFPLRSMTLKYDKDGTVLSLYPFEYSLKVLNYESTFEELHNRIDAQLKSMPRVEDLLKNITGGKEDSS